LAQPINRQASPDVYLITIDTLRADHVHCYGYDRIETPALDSLCRDGIRFSKAFTPSPITNTSHISIMTGLLPSAHGVTDFGIPLAKTIPTWAQLLQQHGYSTAAFIGAVILDSTTLAPGLDRGFDFYDNFPANAPANQHWGRVERRGGDVVRRAEHWMTAHPGGPRFVWVHLYDPHDPYEPPPPYSLRYKDRPYDGEIAYADSALGDLLAYLKHQESYRKAMIVVVGDHGEGLGEHGEQTHGIFLYDATTHVPLIMKLPGESAGLSQTMRGKVIEEQVETTDILPTVLDTVGIPPPASLTGRSLTQHFAVGGEREATIFGETDYPLRFGWAPLRAVRAGGFKFIEAPRPELYDLRSDPAELDNKYEPWNTTVQELRRDLAASGMRPPRPSLSPGKAGSDTLNELRALGYLGPSDARSSTNVPELSSLPDPKDKIEEQNLLHSAMMASEQSRPGEARLLLERVLAIDPESPAALRQLGELELGAKQYREAAEHFRKAQQQQTGDPAMGYYEGLALDKLGDRNSAKDSLEAALKLSPGQLRTRLLLARVYLELGDRGSAEEQYEAALLLAPESEEAALALAGAYLDERRFADAVELLRPRSQSKAANPELFRLLGQAYLGLGKKQDAEREISRAKALSH
jgi:arylsulfatase A-like enzyme/Flp pilus assembly protein TadD